MMELHSGWHEELNSLAREQNEARRIEPTNLVAVPGVAFPYRLTETHVEFGSKDKLDDETIWQPICGRLEVIGLTRNERGEDWGRLVRFKDSDGRQKEVAIPMHLFAGNGNEVRGLLLRLGLSIEPNRKAREALDGYLQKCNPPRRIRCVDHVGWHHDGDGRSFVLPDQVIGSANVVLQSDEYLDHAYDVAGELSAWHQRVGNLAVGNSHLTFAISVALAAPLLELLDMEGGGFHFSGASSTGKTTLLRVAGSVWGGGPNGFHRSWRTTANGLEAVAKLHNDALLGIDEIGQGEGRDVERIPYMLGNGTGKSRAARTGGARRVHRWHLLFLSTGEQSLSEKVQEEGGRRVRAGQEIRILDIPADAGAGLGCFEKLHGFSSAAALADHLIEGACQVYGTPAREFIRCLLREGPDFRETLKSAIKRFKDGLGLTTANGQLERAAARFGLVAVAGELAAGYGVTPWPEGTATDAARACFKAWFDARGGARSGELTSLLKQVRRFFAAHGESRFAPIKKDSRDVLPAETMYPPSPETKAGATYNRVGFRFDDDEGTHYLVLPHAMAEVCEGFPRTWAAKELVSAGLVLPGENGHSQKKHRIPGRKEPTRVYHFMPAVLESEDADCH